MYIQLAVFLYFYLLYLVLNSWDRNDAIPTSLYARETVQLLQQETMDFYLPRSVATKQFGP